MEKKVLKSKERGGQDDWNKSGIGLKGNRKSIANMGLSDFSVCVCLYPKQEPVGDTSCDKGQLVTDLTVNKEEDFDLIEVERVALLGNLWMMPQACSAIRPAAPPHYRLGIICIEPICKTNSSSLLHFFASYVPVCA